jgi:hypothetical protein
MRDRPLCGASLDTLADRIWPGVAHFGPIPVLSASGSRRPMLLKNSPGKRLLFGGFDETMGSASVIF